MNNQNMNSGTDSSNQIGYIPSSLNYGSLDGPDSSSGYTRNNKSLANHDNCLDGPDEMLTQQSNGQLHTINNNFSDWPTVSNNLLIFRDDVHYFQYMKYLQYKIMDPQIFALGLSQDDVLEMIEQRIGFVSLRHVTEERFQKMNEIGWKSLQEIPGRHFIPDLITKSCLNPQTDVQVGDKISHYVNEYYLVTISAGNKELLNKLHQLSHYASLEDIYSTSICVVPGDFFKIITTVEMSLTLSPDNRGFYTNGTSVEVSSPGIKDVVGDYGGTKGSVIKSVSTGAVIQSVRSNIRIGGNAADSGHSGGSFKPSASDYYMYTQIPPTVSAADPCNNPTLVKVVGGKVLRVLVDGNTGFWIPGSETFVNTKFTIEWGDGKPNSDGGTSDTMGTVTHDYLTSGTRTLRVKAKPMDLIYSGTHLTPEFSTPVTVPLDCLFGESRDTGTIWSYNHPDTPDKAWSSRHWFKNTSSHTKSGASTEAFTLVGSDWKIWKADRVYVRYHVRRLNNDCSFIGDTGQETGPEKQKKVSVEDVNLGKSGFFKIESTHGLGAGGTMFYYAMRTTVCGHERIY